MSSRELKQSFAIGEKENACLENHVRSEKPVSCYASARSAASSCQPFAFRLQKHRATHIASAVPAASMSASHISGVAPSPVWGMFGFAFTMSVPSAYAPLASVTRSV